MLSPRLLGCLGIACLLAAGCTQDELGSQIPGPPSTVAEARVEGAGVGFELRIGMVLNISAPTAARDEKVRAVFDAAIQASPRAAIASLEVVQIDEAEDAADAVDALRDLGVTVVVTTCDDGTIPGVVEAGQLAEMLVLTGCPTIPQPEIATSSELIVDAGALATSPDAAMVALDQLIGTGGDTTFAVIASDLVPDVADECNAIEEQLGADSIIVSERFTGLVEDPTDTLLERNELLSTVDAVVVCALAPTVGDVVSALRSNGLEQPIVAPWFADAQLWPEDTNDVWLVSPSSRYGDDPADEVNSLYRVIDESESTDVVAADTLSILVDAARRTGSVEPAALGDALRDGTIEALSGELTVNRADQVERAYRLIEVVDGMPEFSRLINP